MAKAKTVFDWGGKSFQNKVKKAAKKGLKQTAEDAVNVAQSLVREKSGNLKRSIRLQQDEVIEGKAGFGIEVGSDKDEIEYADMQEEGPHNGRDYEFTPYLTPAVRVAGAEIGKHVKENL